MSAIKIKDMIISIQHLPGKKRPRLVVNFDGETTGYQVAIMDSEDKSKWLMELLQERLEEGEA